MIRFATVGTNWITERFLEAASAIDDFQLTAVYSRTEERAAEFAGKHGAAHYFTSLKEMAESKAYDAVYLASPNAFHKEQAALLWNTASMYCAKNRLRLTQGKRMK